MSTIDPKKIAFRGTTNRDLQKHIDNYFTTLGGINPEGLNYTSSNYYYFIDDFGKIIRTDKLSVGYTEREPGDYFKNSLGGIKDERKFAFLGSKDPEIQEATINFFVKLGATNRQKLLCKNSDMYYFIDQKNEIDCTSIFPEGYIFQLDTYLNVMKNQEEKIPEYVECVEEQPQHNNYGELGKIYKVLDWNCSITDCMLVGTTSGSTAKKRFKPSTKEAYDAQNNPLKAAEYTPQVAEWSIGTYAVGIKGNFGIFSGPNEKLSIGSIFTIIGNNETNNSVGVKETIYWIYKENLKWFATYDEAVQFSKRLQPEASPTAAVSESPLEICKRKYKRGIKVRSALDVGVFSGDFIIDVDPSEFYYTGDGVDYFGSKGWLYINGKFADILEEPKEDSPNVILEQPLREKIETLVQYPVTPENAFPAKAIQKQIKKNKFQEVHEIKTVEEKLLKKTKSKLFNI